MPLDPQALLATQAAMHFVPPRDSSGYATAAVRLQDNGRDVLFNASGIAKEEGTDHDKRPQLRPMRIREIPRVIRTVCDALDDSHDPVKHYLVDTPDFKPTRLTSLVNYISMLIMYTLWVLLGVAWVINDGDSFIVANLKAPHERPTPSRIVQWFFDLFWKFNGPFGFIFTAEQRRRHTHLYTAQTKATNHLLGSLSNSMLDISAVATHPRAQRRGYASALVKMVTDEADRQNRATYLYLSTFAQNLAFYERLGFEVMGTYEVGGGELAREEEGEGPVTVGMMVRRPHRGLDVKVADLV